MGAFDLLAKAAKGAKKAAPFFSKADVVLDELQRGKGVGNEFLGELVKKGAKPTELRERGIEKALKDKPKMTKAEVQKIFESNPPPRVQEKVLSSEVPDYDEWLENKAQEIYGVDWFDLRKEEQKALNKMYGDLPLTQYDKYKTPGGENYREILLKLPKRGLTKLEQDELMLYEADLRRTNGQATPERMARYQELKAKEPAGATNYTSSHYREDPNLLAHIRVQDYQVPSKGYAVVNTRSGFKSEVFPTMEQAQAALVQYPESLQTMLKVTEAQGKPKKVLLVDEIQSDWHQEGREKGYFDKSRLDQLDKKLKEVASLPDEEAEEYNRLVRMESFPKTQGGVPNAPFKKNWHELAMKRVLDYAAENGYDSVAITPGAEQAKRYDLSKHVNDIEWDSETNTLTAWDHNGVSVVKETGVSQENLPNYVGKEVAERLLKVEDPKKQLFGADLQVGGEGMKGFYDKILPDYLNNYGKKYGAQMGEMDLKIGTDLNFPPNNYNLPTSVPGEVQRVHSFDITPQMREEIKTKGQPLYGKVAMPGAEAAAGAGAATIGSEVFDTNNEQQVQNPVHFTENPDAMLLELMQRN